NIAARMGHLEIVSFLLYRNALIEHFNNDGFTPLLSAAAYQKPEAMKVLIEAGANVNAKNVHAAAALHYAAMYGYDDVVAMLIERKADINALTDQGDTPVALAIAHGRREATRLLVAAGADGFVRKSNAPLLLTALFWRKTEIARDLLNDDSIKDVSNEGA